MITAASRLQKELRECQSLVGQGDHSEGRVVLHPDPDGDLFLWSATLYGSADSPYADGRFELSIQVPSNYPFHPPIIHFVTRVCHPNVHIKTGEICLDLLQNAWSPAWTLQSTCTAILTLLTSPAAESPLNCDIANLLRSGDIRGYNSLIKMYTALYAIKTE